jgi:hypothetical protein
MNVMRRGESERDESWWVKIEWTNAGKSGRSPIKVGLNSVK